MKLSIIIPVFNEKSTIKRILENVEKVEIPLEKEIIIVDDFSTDGTRDILKQFNAYKVFYHEKNKGKGAAVRTGLSQATGDIILLQDADLEYNPEEYTRLLEPILSKKASVVFGSRHLGNNEVRYRSYYFGNIMLSLATSLLYFKKVTDMETGYKVFKKDVVQNINLKAKRFDLEPEITAKILKKGYKIHEVPISYSCRAFKEGKKITWKDGLAALWFLVKYRFAD